MPSLSHRKGKVIPCLAGNESFENLVLNQGNWFLYSYWYQQCLHIVGRESFSGAMYILSVSDPVVQVRLPEVRSGGVECEYNKRPCPEPPAQLQLFPTPKKKQQRQEESRKVNVNFNLIDLKVLQASSSRNTKTTKNHDIFAAM